MSGPEPGQVVVTVTYGRRWHLLRQALASARDEGFDLAVVVDNASDDDIGRLAREEFGSFVDVVRLARNTGSAGGFKSAMARAITLGAHYLMVLDDDNRLDAGCRAKLTAAHGRWAKSVAADRLAVQAFRERQRDLAAQAPSRGMHSDNPFAYFGFHWLDIPAKLLRRTALGRKRAAGRPIREEVEIDNSPYSGLYFHRSLIERIGLPDERFVLYCDDLEFSSRITRAGGKIVLVTAARLVDLEESWDRTASIGNAFDSRLIGDGDFRAFYSTRNNAYFEHFILGAPGPVRRVNRLIFFAILRWRALMHHRMARYRLLISAIRDGESGKLGEDPAFRLP